MTRYRLHTARQASKRRVQPHTSEDELLSHSTARPSAAGLHQPANLLHLQRSIGNQAIQRLLQQQAYSEDQIAADAQKPEARSLMQTSAAPVPSLQLGRQTTLKKKIKKERKIKPWKKGRLWPEQQLKGRLLERLDKYMIRTTDSGYIDMNKIKANFPAIDGIADGTFRQVKCYLPSKSVKSKREARRQAVQRIVAQVVELEEKCEIAARQLLANEGHLLGLLLEIDMGSRSTKGRTGKAPYDEMDTSDAARSKHMGVLPDDFREFGLSQFDDFGLAMAEDRDFDFDEDGLAQLILSNMVVIVPDDLVEDVEIELAARNIDIPVEGGGGKSKLIQYLMDDIGYAPSRRKSSGDDDGDYVPS